MPPPATWPEPMPMPHLASIALMDGRFKPIAAQVEWAHWDVLHQIRALIRDKGHLSYATAAKSIGLSQPFLSMILSGKRKLSESHLRRILEGLRATEAELIAARPTDTERLDPRGRPPGVAMPAVGAGQTGHRVRERREALGLNKRSLARKAGMNPSRITQIEERQGRCQISTLERLAAALECVIDDLLPPLPDLP